MILKTQEEVFMKVNLLFIVEDWYFKTIHVLGLIKNVTAVGTHLLTGLLFISVSYQSLVYVLSRALHKAEEKAGLLLSLVKQTM